MRTKNAARITKGESAHMGRPLPGYEAQYEARNDGLIYSLRTGRPIKGCQSERGYLHVSLCRDGKAKTTSAHRAVCAAFHGLPDAGMTVNHKNGDKTDNRPDNLEWVTQSENSRHAFRVLGRLNGKSMLGRFGSDHNRAVAVTAYPIRDGEPMSFGSIHEAARAGFNASSICACINGRRRVHKGYAWNRTDEN